MELTRNGNLICFSIIKNLANLVTFVNAVSYDPDEQIEVLWQYFCVTNPTREAAPRSRNFKIREIEFFLGACASAAIYKNYAEVGAYNSSWIKSYEHRSKFIFISARPS